MMPTNYLRSGLLQGLKYEKTLGVNPFKFGFIGGTDVHNSLSCDRGGQLLRQACEPGAEPDPLGACLQAGLRQDALHLPLHRRRLRGGLGHREHPRGAVGRDEAQGGLRHQRTAPRGALLRRLGLSRQPGVDSARFVEGRLRQRRADGRRSPGAAGGRGQGRPHRTSPSGRCAIPATGEPSAPLQRIQIVKGYLQDGEPAEKVYDVAGQRAKNGASVDSRRPVRHRGAPAPTSSASVWRDPDFDPRRARCTTSGCSKSRRRAGPPARNARGIKLPSRHAPPPKNQERAWTSPIWYTPG